MYECCRALRDVLLVLGVSIDGGKDSLSMAARVGEEVVKSPGNLTISAYCTVPDITKTVTPDLKRPDESSLIFIDLGGGKARLGGTALAQCYEQLGNESPDLENPAALASLFTVTQTLIEERALLAGHDRSDGGLITTLLEMAFAGNCGIDVDVHMDGKSDVEALFNEEVGVVVEVPTDKAAGIVGAYTAAGLSAAIIGKTTSAKAVVVKVNGVTAIEGDVAALRDVWEATSFQLEMRQTNPSCVEQVRGSSADEECSWPDIGMCICL